jgi:hypothetical protein
MNKRKDRMVRKQIVQRGELRQSRIGRYRQRMIAMYHYRQEVYHPPHRDRNSNQRQKNDGEPNCPLPPNSELHTYYYV